MNDEELETKLREEARDLAAAMRMPEYEAYDRIRYALSDPIAMQQSSKVALEILFRPLRKKTAALLRRLQGKKEASDGE